MATSGQALTIISGRATAAITEGYLVQLDVSDCEYPGEPNYELAGANGRLVGVCTEPATAADDRVGICTSGSGVKVACNGATDIGAGDPVEANSSGIGVLATGAGQHNIIGYALAAYTVDATALIPCEIRPEQITL